MPIYLTKFDWSNINGQIIWHYVTSQINISKSIWPNLTCQIKACEYIWQNLTGQILRDK